MLRLNAVPFCLVEPIKETGEYKVAIRLYKDVEPEITVTVVAEEKQDK